MTPSSLSYTCISARRLWTKTHSHFPARLKNVLNITKQTDPGFYNQMRSFLIPACQFNGTSGMSGMDRRNGTFVRNMCQNLQPGMHSHCQFSSLSCYQIEVLYPAMQMRPVTPCPSASSNKLYHMYTQANGSIWSSHVSKNNKFMHVSFRLIHLNCDIQIKHSYKSACLNFLCRNTNPTASSHSRLRLLPNHTILYVLLRHDYHQLSSNCTKTFQMGEFRPNQMGRFMFFNTRAPSGDPGVCPGWSAHYVLTRTTSGSHFNIRMKHTDPFPDLLEEDLEEKFVRGHGPGGQSVNKTTNCVVLKHKPTGVVIKCHESRSLDTNRERARLRMKQKLDWYYNRDNSQAEQEKRQASRQRKEKKKKTREKLEKLKAFKEREGLE